MSQAIINKLYEIWTRLGDGNTKVQIDQTTPGTTNGVSLMSSNVAEGIADMALNTEGTVLASAARTTSSNSADITITNGSKLAVFLDVTAFSGTSPTLDVSVKAKDSVSGKYFTIGTFTQAVGVSSEAIFIGGGADVEFPTRTFRVEYTIGGTTPSFTFSVGYAVSV